MDEITIGDKLYVSSKRAAQITGYAKDYIGQLCREGRVEARLVGRNWYVLDSALREHRFGKAAEETTTQEEEKVAESPISTWKRPEYIPETPAFVPTLAPKPEKSEEVQIGTPAIADMQTAWREWFEEKKDTSGNDSTEGPPYEVPLVDKEPEPESVAPVNEPETEKVPFNRLEEVQNAPEEEIVEIHREYRAMAPVIREISNESVGELYKAPAPKVKELKSDRSPILAQVALVLLSFVAVSVALLGTGQADKLLGGTSINFGFQKVITDYLGGKSEYKSSL